MRSFFATLRQLVLPAGTGPGSPRVVIGPDLPPPLDTYLWFGTTRATAAIVFFGTSITTYMFIAFIPSAGFFSIHVGNVVAGVVIETAPGSPVGQTWSLSGTPNQNTLDFTLGSADDFRIDSIPQGRGLRAVIADTLNGPVIGGVETAVLTAIVGFASGRAYRISHRGEWLGTGSNTVAILIRQNGTGGNILDFNAGHELNSNPLISQRIYGETYVVNTTGAPVLATVDVTAFAASGTAQQLASANRPRYLHVEDVGAAIFYPGFVSVI